MKTRVLIIEDEDSIRKFVSINLEKGGYDVYEASSGEEGIEIIKSQNIDILVLDIMLPGIDGFEVAKILRKEYPNIGIIMLTAKGQDEDKIMGLECGTDDYLTKPFNPTELVLRVDSLSRRLKKVIDKKASIFTIDVYSRKFYKFNEEIFLTPTEFSIVELFMENPGKAFTREELMEKVWGYDFLGETKIVDVNIRRIRSKIEDDTKNPKVLETVWGIGYRWNPD
ncbi:MAG: response regulator transcription factor [Tissierellia bacterium]|nr:response regulator transcription factor [Tissierellia bacterium]